MARIARAGRHLLALVDDLPDVARMNAGDLAVSDEPILVDGVIEEAFEIARPMADERSVSLRFESVGPSDRYGRGDRERLVQILMHLLSNAVKFNHAGGSVTVSWTDVTGGRVRIAVEATGRGIPREKLPRLFAPFDRLEAEEHGVEGTGLGLTVAQRLIELMGGPWTRTARRGAGTCSGSIWSRPRRRPIDLAPHARRAP